MANMRMINTWIWKDPWFVDLRLTEQHLFIYLLTSPQTNVLGVYEISLREMAFDTGIDQEEIKRIFRDRLAVDGKAFYEMGWVVMRNWLKHQNLNSNQTIGARRLFENLPEWLSERLTDPSDTLYIPHIKDLKPFETLPNPLKHLPTIEKNRNKKKVTEKNIVNTSVLTRAEPKDERNGDVQAVIDKFEVALGLKMSRPVYQRRAAKTLIQRYTLEKTLAAIDAVVACRDERYAPRIVSVEDLRDKWNNLVEFYRDKQTGKHGGIAIIS